ADAEMAPERPDHLLRGGVAVVGELVDERPRHLATAGEGAAEPRVRLRLGPRAARERERGAGHERLQAPVARAVARAPRAALVDDDVPELAGRARGPAEDPPVDEHPPADAGPDREDEDIARA